MDKFDWQRFFVLAGIPPEVASKYSASFKQNRISRDMLNDLDKTTLSELGVTAIGDQLAILRRIKDSAGALSMVGSTQPDRKAASSMRIRISGPPTTREEFEDDIQCISMGTTAARKRAPDSHEIYHVKMPDGNTHRTKHIMRKAENLRRNGLSVRGTTGVRQAGRSVSPIDKNSVAVRGMRREAEVSSTTDPVIERLGVRGLRSDAAGGRRATLAGRVAKKTVPAARNSVSVLSRVSAPNPRAHSIVSRAQKTSNIASRISTSSLPRVSIDLTGTRPTTVRSLRAGQGQVAVSGPGRLQKRLGQQRRPVQNRISTTGAGRVQRSGQRTAWPSRSNQFDIDPPEEEYEDDLIEGEEEYMEDEQMYEDGDNFDELGEDGYEEDEQEIDEYVEYVAAPRGGRNNIFSRLSK